MIAEILFLVSTLIQKNKELKYNRLVFDANGNLQFEGLVRQAQCQDDIKSLNRSYTLS